MKLTLLIDEASLRIVMVYCDNCKGKGGFHIFDTKSRECDECKGAGHIVGHPLEGASITPKELEEPVHTELAVLSADGSKASTIGLSCFRELSLEQLFLELADKWHEETAYTSSGTEICMNPSYQAIIGLGPAIVPRLLRALQHEPDHWFWALRALTREDPVPKEVWGNLPAMASYWIEWGKKRGLI